MTFLEKDLEQIIWESDNQKLQQRNLEIYGKKYRQLRIGNYGILDLLTVQKMYYYSNDYEHLIPYLNITVYELKKEKAGISAFLQAIRYCKGIKSYLNEKYPSIEFDLNIVLVAKEVDLSGDFIFLTDLLTYYANEPFNRVKEVLFYSFNYDLDGINFQNHRGYSLNNQGF